MESTGIFDQNGIEIFVGTTVAWGKGHCSSKEHGLLTLFGLYKITKVVEDNVVRYNLGNIYNKWTGKDVMVVSDEDFKKYELNYEDQFYMKDGVANKFTMEIWLGKERADELHKAWIDVMWDGFEDASKNTEK